MAKRKGKGEDEDDKQKKGEKKKQLPTEKQLDDAPMSIAISIDGQSLVGDKREFSSGSVGWNASGKVVISGLQCQVSCNIVIVGSKDVK